MNFKTVYEAIKNDSIINRIEEFSCEELKPFLPVLAFAAFSAQDEASSDVSDSLDKLRSRLMEFKQCNSLVELVNVDVDRIIDDLINNPSDINLKINLRCASPYDKVKMIAYALLKIPSSTVLSNANISASATTFADMNLFDEQCSIDELICVMLMCVRRCPDKFDINLIIHALLPLPSAPDLITKLLCNLGDSTEASVEYLIALHYPDSSLLSKQRSDILFKLMSLDHYVVNRSLERMLSQRNNILSLNIICNCLNDTELITWLLYILTKRLPLASFIRRHSKRTSVKLLHERLSQLINSFLSRKYSSEEESKLVQLLGALIVVGGLELSSDETRQWILFITRTECADERYVCMALSVIFACARLISNYSDESREIDDSLIAFFDSIKTRIRSADCSSTLQHFILLVSIHLHSNDTRKLAKLISSSLYFEIKLDIRSLTKIRSLFLRHATSERELIHKVSLLPVITKFNGSHKGFLSAHCITQLLTARSFAKHSIPIHEWISSQIVECTIPVHPAIVELITSYASSCLPIDSDCNVSEPLSQQFIQELFFGDMIDERRLVPRLLTLFFMLSLKYQLDKFDYSHHNNVSYPYKEEFECRLPIRYMIGVMNARPDDFHELRPQLLKVVSHFYAYMLPNANSFLYDINSDLRSSSFKTDGISEVNATCEMELEMKCPMKSLALIEQFEWSRLQKQIHLRNFVLKTMNMVVDKQNMSDPFIKSLIYIWMRIENIETVQFVEETVQALSGLRITHEMLCMQPMLLYESNDYVFRNAPLFSCFLRILSFYQSASRHILMHKCHKILNVPSSNANNNRQDTRTEREELAKSLFGAQDSELVQMLLEVCCEFGDDKVKKLACDHIHQMFIADTSLLKLVHFQGYPLSMISMTVRLIPSMHACLDFVHDILALRDLTKRLFATLLIIELAKQYRIEQWYIRIDLLLNLIWTIGRILPFDEALAYLSLLIPSLSQIMDIFPQINDDISFLLSEISKLINDGMKASSTVAVTNDCHAQKLLDDIACVISKRGDIITYKCLGS